MCLLHRITPTLAIIPLSVLGSVIMYRPCSPILLFKSVCKINEIPACFVVKHAEITKTNHPDSLAVKLDISFQYNSMLFRATAHILFIRIKTTHPAWPFYQDWIARILRIFLKLLF